MKMRVTILALVLSATTVKANDDAGKLARSCKGVAAVAAPGASSGDRKADLEALMCLEFVRGFREGYAGGSWGAPKHPLSICIPDAATDFQLIAVFTRWAEQNPTMWHLSRRAGLSMALHDGFPCPAPK